MDRVEDAEPHELHILPITLLLLLFIANNYEGNWNL